MKINVTQSNIKCGIRSNARMCPVAIAILDATGKHTGRGVVVLPDKITIRGNGKFKTPRSVKKFIYEFDNFCRARPFSFILKGL